MTLHPAHDPPRRRGTVLRAAILIGAGLGGLLDGILFHRILGWHHLLSGWTSDPATNRMADGLFDAAMWLVTVAGVFLLWHAWRRWGEPRPTSRLLGGLLMGAGGFTAAESVVDHHLLGTHHVAPGAALAWDLALLGVSVAVFALGAFVARSSNRRLDRTSQHPHTRV